MVDASIAYSATCFWARNGESMFHHQWLFAAESCHLLHDNGPSVRNKRLSACAYAPLSVPQAPTWHTLYELMAVMNQGIGRTNTHIQPSCNLFNCYSSLFMNQFQCSFFNPRSRGCSWTSGALWIRHTCVAIFEHFNPLIDKSTRENFIPILSTHAEMIFVLPAHLLPTKSVWPNAVPLCCNL